MKITEVTTYLVGNPWKNWLFVRVDTDEGVHGVGEGSVNAFARTVATAVDELRAQFLGLDPSQVELLSQRMVRDVSAPPHGDRGAPRCRRWQST